MPREGSQRQEIPKCIRHRLSKIIGGHAKADLDAAKTAGEDAGKAKMDEILKKLDDAFTKVEGQKSASGKTYGDLIKAGKLPAGN